VKKRKYRNYLQNLARFLNLFKHRTVTPGGTHPGHQKQKQKQKQKMRRRKYIFPVNRKPPPLLSLPLYLNRSDRGEVITFSP
jgi:hypothetical protein